MVDDKPPTSTIRRV